jgi:hypothetical protein
MKVMRCLLGMLCVSQALAGTAAAQTKTKVIDNGPDAGKKILVVMGDGYATADQSKYNQDVDTLVVGGVFGNDFFREDQDGFNVYRLNLVSAESGVSQRVYDEHGTPSDGSDDTIVSTTMKNTALKYIWSGSWAHCWLEGSAQTGTLVQDALTANVPNYDYVVVILNQDSYGGCGGGGFQIVPRGVTWPVLAHEYGHGIGGLADEYFNSGTSYSGPTINGPNIASVLDRNNVWWRRFISPATAVPTTFGAGMDPNRTVGEFQGAGTKETGLYRPVDDCRMRSNSPKFCPACYTTMKKALYPFVKHNFSDAVVGDFSGDGRSDLLIHNAQDLEIYDTNGSNNTMDSTWVANNIVPAAPGGNTWQPASNDKYYVGDFNGDGKDDVFVFNGSDWAMPYLGLLQSDGTGLKGVARYDGSLPGFWSMKPGDQFFVGDCNADGKADLYIFNGGNWAIPYLGVLRSNGASLSGLARHDGSIPGWIMKPNDHFFAGEFDGDHRVDLFVSNAQDWSVKYLGMLRSSGTALSDVKLFASSLPGWTMNTHDQFFVGDFDANNYADLYVFNGSDWGSTAYLLMAKSTGSNLNFVKQYNSSSAAANIPGWLMRKGDRLFVSDANKDGKADLFVYNPAIDWSTEYLGTLISSGSALSGSWSADWVGGWNLGAVDKILVSHYDGVSGKSDIIIRNDQWAGMIRKATAGFLLDRIYFHWIYTALYDTKPWSDSMP